MGDEGSPISTLSASPNSLSPVYLYDSEPYTSAAQNGHKGPQEAYHSDPIKTRIWREMPAEDQPGGKLPKGVKAIQEVRRICRKTP
jgi:hypothetical protein